MQITALKHSKEMQMPLPYIAIKILVSNLFLTHEVIYVTQSCAQPSLHWYVCSMHHYCIIVHLSVRLYILLYCNSASICTYVRILCAPNTECDSPTLVGTVTLRNQCAWGRSVRHDLSGSSSFPFPPPCAICVCM